MLRTVTQTFSPVVVEEKSLRTFIEDVQRLIQSGLRLTVSVRASSAAASARDVGCIDCGAAGHRSKRYGGCCFYEPRSDRPPPLPVSTPVGPRTYADVCSPMMSPPSSNSPRSQPTRDLMPKPTALQLPKTPASRHGPTAKGRPRTPPPIIRTSPQASLQPPVAAPVRRPPSPPVVDPPLATPPATTSRPPTSPPPSRATPDRSTTSSTPLDRRERCRQLRQRNPKYFNSDGYVCDEWQSLLESEIPVFPEDDPTSWLDFSEHALLKTPGTLTGPLDQSPEVRGHVMGCEEEDYMAPAYEQLHRRVNKFARGKK